MKKAPKMYMQIIALTYPDLKSSDTVLNTQIDIINAIRDTMNAPNSKLLLFIALERITA